MGRFTLQVVVTLVATLIGKQMRNKMTDLTVNQIIKTLQDLVKDRDCGDKVVWFEDSSGYNYEVVNIVIDNHGDIILK